MARNVQRPSGGLAGRMPAWITPLSSSQPGLELWMVEPDRIADTTQALAERMDAEERRRASAMRSEQRQRLFVAAHVGLRHVLSSCLDVDADAIAYCSSGPAGKPQLHPALGSSLRFNMSHTHGLAIVAVALGREVGVDVEWTGRRIHHLRRSEAAGCSEAAGHPEAADPAGRRRFLAQWTRREAVAKLTGQGLAGMLAQGRRQPEPPGEFFTLLDLAPTPEHVGAVALAGPSHR